MQGNRLWLHVGPAKTGTSSIQTTFRMHRDHLEQNGLLYPEVSDGTWGSFRNNHSSLARALQGGDLDFVERVIDGLPPFPDTVISSEGFPKSTPPVLARFTELLDRKYRLRVIYYARDPVDHAISSAGQAIKAGHASYAEIIATENPKPRLRKQIERLTRAFGKERMIVREFSQPAFYNGDLISDFCYVIGRKGLLHGREIARRDGAITMEDVPFIEAQHGKRAADTLPPEGTLPKDGGRKFTLPADYLDKVRRNASADLDWLFETHGIDFR